MTEAESHGPRRARAAWLLALAAFALALVLTLSVVIRRDTGAEGKGKASKNTKTSSAPIAAAVPVGDRVGCDDDTVLRIAFLGDMKVHKPLLEQGLRDGFDSLWHDVAPLWSAADLTWANLEGSLACCLDAEGRTLADPGPRFDGVVYTSSSKGGLNFHPSFARGLADAGIDVLTTANNHSLDRGVAGVSTTLDVLDAAGLVHAGTRRTPREPWDVVVERNGLTINFVACAQWTNRKPAEGRAHVLNCTEDREEVLGLVRRAASSSDVVVFAPHGGTEDRVLPDARLRGLAEAAADAGATVVVSSHPHNPQTWERRQTPDGRVVPLLWGRGNYLTFAGAREATASTLAFVDFTRTRAGRVVAGLVTHVPIALVTDAKGRRLAPATPTTHPVAHRMMTTRYGGAGALDPALPLDPRAVCARPAAAAFGAIGDVCAAPVPCATGLLCEPTVDGQGTCTSACADDEGCGGGRCVDGRCRGVCATDDDCHLQTRCAAGACIASP